MSLSATLLKPPATLWGHFKDVLQYHQVYGDNVRNINKIEQGIVGLDRVFNTNLHGRVTAFRDGVHNRVKCALPHPDFFNHVTKTQQVAMLILGPLAFCHYANETKKNCSHIFTSFSNRLRTFYHITRTAGSLALTSVSICAATPGAQLLLELTHSSEKLLRVCDAVGKCAFRIFFFLGLAFPLTYALEAYQSHNVTDLRDLDPVIIKDSLGLKPDNLSTQQQEGLEVKERKLEFHINDETKKPLLNDQLLFYKRMRMVQTANSVLELVCNVLILASPVAPPLALIGLAVSTLVKLGANYWLKRSVKQLHVKLQIKPEKSDPTISTASRVLSAVATPFLSVAKSAPIAVGVIAASVVVDITVNLYQA